MANICLKYLNLNNGAAGVNMGTLPDDGYAAVNYTATSLFTKGHIQGIDNELGSLYSGALVQTGAVDPAATLVVPDFVGQVFVNTTTKELWVSASIIPGDWVNVVESLSALGDLSDVSLVAELDGDILAFDGANWVNTKEIGPTHDRHGVTSAALLGGAGAQSFPGDGVAPFAADRAVGIGGSSTELYGDDSVALNNGRSFGQQSTAINGGTAGGNLSLALGGAIAAGHSSFAGLGDAEAGGGSSVAFGGLGTKTGLGAPAVVVANSGLDLEVTIPGEDLTAIFTGGQLIQLFDFSGGTYDPTTGAAGDASALFLLVDSAIVNLGDTVITVLNVNHNAAAAKLNYDGLGLHSMAFGENVQVHQNYSFAFGKTNAAWGDHGLAFGEEAEVGELGASPQPEYGLSFGKSTNALFDYSHAMGQQAQTRNKYERAFSAGMLGALEWSQERIVFLNQSVVTGGGPQPMYTDGLSGGTEEIATFSDHTYLVTAYVLGSVDASGTVKCAAWKLEAVFQQDSGVLTQVGVTTTTAIANGDAGVFDTAPAFAVSGTNIRINVEDDGSGLDTLDWAARVTMVELAAR